ncbi:restriction endonuclease subunit S [uncultured Alistipes sp.]|uniref:restriction endonuclease subunit S n=1 Tax=uncultured Alistipes sp. TaxID=538949 RepID=UPI00320B09EC
MSRDTRMSRDILKNIIQINPTERLAKGTLAKKVPMEYLQPFTRAISSYETAEYSGGSKFRNGDTLMARITPCLENGKTAYVSILDDGEVGFGSTEYIVFRNIEGVTDSKFVYYFVTSPWFREIAIKSMVGSSGRQRVQQSVLENLEVTLPPLEEQRRIAGILGSLDDKIELNRRINANLETQAQALFRSWFVDFEPFRDGPFIDSELGKIPQGWKVVELQTLVTIKRGGSPRPIQNFLSDSGYNWLKISDATSEQSPYIYDIKEHIKESGLNKTVYIKSGELVLSNSATPGIPKMLGVDSCIHDGWLYFPKSALSNEFLYLLFKENRENFLSQGNGSVFLNLKTDILKSFKIIIPNNLDELKEFNIILHNIFQEIKYKTEEIKTLSTLRDTLLPKLMAGEINC